MVHIDNNSWTAQSAHSFVHSDGVPGQTFKRSELPDPEQQRAGGVDPELWRKGYGLWIEEDEPVDAEPTEDK